VIATHFGCEEWLYTVTASILRQSLHELELWLIDDCSPDDRWLSAIGHHRRDFLLRCF
jgi:glycosyltransferase involved in cell wall biosynthesis